MALTAVIMGDKAMDGMDGMPNLGREIWNGIDLPLLIRTEEQMDVDRVIFSGSDFAAFRKYVKDFGLKDTFEAMLREGWDRDRAINVLKIVTTRMPESPLK